VTTPSHDIAPQGSSSFDQALTAFQEALGLVDGENEPGFYGVVLHDIADAYKAKGEDQEALARYRESVKYKRLADNPADLATTLRALGDALIDCDELTEARITLDQIKELLAKEIDNMERARRAVRFHSLGRGYERLGARAQEGAYAEALDAYQIALELVDAAADPGSYATVLRDIGDVHKARGFLTEAIVAYETAVEHMRRRPDAQRSLAAILVDLGRVRRRVGALESQPQADNGEDQQSEPTTEDHAGSGQSQEGTDFLR